MTFATSFGVRPGLSTPLALKIERLVARKAADKAAIDLIDRGIRRAKAKTERSVARRLFRAQEARRELKLHRAVASNAGLSRPTRILWEVAQQHGVSLDDLRSRSIRRLCTAPRFEAYWRLYCETNLSMIQISQLLRRKDHTCVVHGLQTYMQRNGLTPPEHRRHG